MFIATAQQISTWRALWKAKIFAVLLDLLLKKKKEKKEKKEKMRA